MRCHVSATDMGTPGACVCALYMYFICMGTVQVYAHAWVSVHVCA